MFYHRTQSCSPVAKQDPVLVKSLLVSMHMFPMYIQMQDECLKILPLKFPSVHVLEIQSNVLKQMAAMRTYLMKEHHIPQKD